jgi:hypothetical protein
VNLSAELTPEELFTRAIARFDTAIVVANASKTGATAANIAAATDLVNMSNVGAARAALKMGDLAKARTYAALVPANYEKLAYYSSNSVRENNQLNRPARTADPFLGVAPAFFSLNDPRVPRLATSRPGLNSNPIFPPQRPLMYTGWSASTIQPIDITTTIKFATGLEAQYVIAEADGATPATLTFVNARRAAGNQAPVSLTGAASWRSASLPEGGNRSLPERKVSGVQRFLRGQQVLHRSAQ